MSDYRPIQERLQDFQPVELPLVDEVLAWELTRCQDCGVPFCHSVGCPLANVIPEINAAALGGQWDKALALLITTNPFPEFTARVCPALCEGSCVQGLNEESVPERRIEFQVIERGFAANLLISRPPKRWLDLTAAVIGSGPAGLAAAWALNRLGVQVTVYEKAARPGGFMRYGIPDFKLPKTILDRRVVLMKQDGIIFKCGVEIGVDMSVRLLRRRHKILILAIGARCRRDLAIPGRNLAGVLFATNYLVAQNQLIGGEISDLPAEFNAQGRRVIVLGGGDTGSDCVGTALRQGAVSVSQFEILPRPPESRDGDNPWPQWPRVLRTSSSQEEGGLRRWNIDTVEFLPAAHNPAVLGTLVGREVTWDTSGLSFRPTPIPGSEFHEEVDLVLLALGFTGVAYGPLLAKLDLQPDLRGLISTQPGMEGRLAPGLYAVGDAVSGPSLVARAVASGLVTARTVQVDYGLETI